MSEFTSESGPGLKSWIDNNRSKAVVSVAAVGMVVLFFGSMLFSEDDSSVIPSVRVKRGDVTIKITESGELRAADQVTIGAVTDKQILWLAPEGSWVEKGDTLIKFESQKYEISTDEARSALAMARADSVKAVSDYESQLAKEEAARRKYESLPQLAEQGFVQQSEVEQARLAYMEVKSQTRAYQAAVEAARANVLRAKKAVEQQERKLARGIVLAPRAGLVVYATTGDEETAKKISVGMVPFEGMDLMYLPDISKMLVDSEISEVDLSRVKPGQPAEIRLDAYSDTTFQGEVSNIADLARRKISRVTGTATGAKVFDITVRVLAKDVRLKPGLTATVDIIVQQYENALYVPLEAIFLNELEQTVVYVKKKNGDIETRKVVVGDSTDRIAVITEGLEEGEEVLLGEPNSA